MTNWPEVVREYGPVVWRTACRLLGQEADAADCFQRTFLSAVELDAVQPVRNWAGVLKRIATTRALDQLRARHRLAARSTGLPTDLPADPAAPDPADLAAGGELADALRVALAALGGNANLDPGTHPSVLQAKAQLQRQQLNVVYTDVHAPSDGIVTRVEQMPVGTYLNASQAGFWLLSGDPWIEANFKEDQLRYMRLGQPATVEIAAYSGQEIRGRVASFSPGTGNAFALLPAENATGNWVKVVQRLPVEIELENPPADLPLHAGLSADVSVDTGHQRNLFGPDTPPVQRKQAP